jgi:hypothetical protein
MMGAAKEAERNRTQASRRDDCRLRTCEPAEARPTVSRSVEVNESPNRATARDCVRSQLGGICGSRVSELLRCGSIAPTSARSWYAVFVSSDRIKTEAEALRLAVLCGLASPQDIIRWADRTIADEPSPLISIIDLALAVNEGADRLVVRLSDIPGEGSHDGAIRLLLKVLLERLDRETDPRTIAEYLYRLSRTAAWPEEKFGTEPYWLDDLFQPETAFGGTYYREAMAALREYLTKHTTNVVDQFVLPVS